jgi:hypothetical protein
MVGNLPNTKVRMRTNQRLAWLLIASAGLAGMLAGHACELWLEGMHAFGEQQAHYNHVGQGLVAELAVGLLVVVVVAILRFWFSLSHRKDADQLVPALHAIANGSFGRLYCKLISLQLVALIMTEFFEQRLSGYQGNVLASIAGPGHASALAVHLIIGGFIALLVYTFARFVSARSRVLVDAVIAFVRWAMAYVAAGGYAGPQRVSTSSVFAQRLSLISLGLANRPPPQTSLLLA